MKKEMSYLYLVYIGYLETIICYICTKKKETENEKKKIGFIYSCIQKQLLASNTKNERF